MLKLNTAYLCVLLVLVLGAGLALFTMQLNCVPSSMPPSKACVGFAVFKDMQTLVAGLLALGAALIAVRPVYLQLEKMRVQTDIAARDIIAARTRKIDERARHDIEMVRKIHDQFRYVMDHECTEFPPG